MRTPLIAGNWKMNNTVAESVELVKAMRFELNRIEDVEKAVCPPFMSLAAVHELLKGTSIKLGAQDVFYEEKGAYTGAVSPLMVSELCEYVIIGHSERRQYFDETGTIINKKLAAAMKVGLKPILCVGERLEENEAGQAEEVISDQLQAALSDIIIAGGLVVAYEPVWAIGTGKAATGPQANTTISFIRKELAGICGAAMAENIRILYGGSVTAVNTAEFMSEPSIDGALVGGASLKAKDFVSIVKQTADLRRRRLA